MTSIQYSPHNRFVCLMCHEVIATGTILVSHNDVLTWHVQCYINLSQLQGFTSLMPEDQKALSILSIQLSQQQQQPTLKNESTSSTTTITASGASPLGNNEIPELSQPQQRHHLVLLTRRMIRQLLNQKKSLSTSLRCKIVGRHHSTIATQPGQPVTLVCEPNNPYDSNAIRVHANHPSEKIGYIEKDLASQLQPILSLLSRLSVVVHAVMTEGPEDNYIAWAELHFQSFFVQNSTTANHDDDDSYPCNISCGTKPISADPTLRIETATSNADIIRKPAIPTTTTSPMMPQKTIPTNVSMPTTTKTKCTQFEGDDDEFYNLLSLPVVSSRKHELIHDDEDSSSSSTSTSSNSCNTNNNKMDKDDDSFSCHKKKRKKSHVVHVKTNNLWWVPSPSALAARQLNFSTACVSPQQHPNNKSCRADASPGQNKIHNPYSKK